MDKPTDEVKELSRNEGYQDGYLAGKIECLTEIVLRVHDKGLSNEQIADLLGITIKAIEDILSKR
ncbi:MAG: hypothetical protein IKM20_10070 [Erysipelotrichales bacterium]|nr:hypothetical protein [Erysipelotrichales bacterium]